MNSTLPNIIIWQKLQLTIWDHDLNVLATWLHDPEKNLSSVLSGL